MFLKNPTNALRFCMSTRTRAEIESGATKLPHSISTMSLSQRKGLIKGWVLRAVDCASSVDILNCSLKCVFRELCSLHYPVKLFRQVLHDLSRRYLILSEAARLSSTSNRLVVKISICSSALLQSTGFSAMEMILYPPVQKRY